MARSRSLSPWWFVALPVLVVSACAGSSGHSSTATCTAVRSTIDGALPTSGTPTVGGVRLPSGDLVTPDPSFSDNASEPSMWMTDAPVDDATTVWRHLAAVYADTGLWPLLLEPLDDPDENRPWSDGELVPGDVAAIDALDPATILAAEWAAAQFDNDFPGLADAEAGCVRDLGDTLAEITGPVRIGLVAVHRPADAITRIGWLGTANYQNDISKYSAVLRSWEDRFGAYLVDVGFDTLGLGVERPPSTSANRDRLAAEIGALAPDLVTQGAGSIANLSSAIGDSSRWTFWWD